MIAAQVLSWAGMWLLQRLAVDTRSWWPVVTSQLASGALGRVVPGGAAAAGALQYRMLVQAGVPSSLAGIGIGVASIVLLATLAALPVLAIPAVLLGVAVPERLWQAGLVGIAVFFALLAIGAMLLASDRALAWVGAPVGPARRRIRPRKPPPDDLLERWTDQRDLVRHALGARWWEAVAGASGRWLFDWLTLVTALAAVGQHPRPTLILLAFCAATLLGAGPDHAGRARRRRGRSDRHARADRRAGGRRRRGDARLPARLVLARAAGRRRRVPDPPPAHPSRAHVASRGSRLSRPARAGRAAST